MERHIRKIVLYKARHIEDMRKELRMLEQARRDIIDESPAPQDGMPHGKGNTSSPTESKVLRLAKLDTRINKLNFEIKTILETREYLTDEQKEIFDNSIVKKVNTDYTIDTGRYSRKYFFNERGKILKAIAIRLGEYYEE